MNYSACICIFFISVIHAMQPGGDDWLSERLKKDLAYHELSSSSCFDGSLLHAEYWDRFRSLDQVTKNNELLQAHQWISDNAWSRVRIIIAAAVIRGAQSNEKEKHPILEKALERHDDQLISLLLMHHDQNKIPLLVCAQNGDPIIFCARNPVCAQLFDLYDEKNYENMRDIHGNTLLHRIAYPGYDWRLISFFLNKGVNPAALNRHLQTPLHLLVLHSEQQSGEDLVTKASEYLKAGVQLAMPDKEGKTVLDRVQQLKDQKIVQDVSQEERRSKKNQSSACERLYRFLQTEYASWKAALESHSS